MKNYKIRNFRQSFFHPSVQPSSICARAEWLLFALRKSASGLNHSGTAANAEIRSLKATQHFLLCTRKKNHTHINNISRKFKFFFGFSSISATFSATIFMLKVEFIDSVMIINRFFFDNTSLCPLTKQK